MRAMRFFLLAVCALCLSCAAPVAQAAYPDKPVRLIVPYAPGGALGMWARTFAAKLSERLGQQVIVDNRPGGSTMIGTAAVAGAEPDGYTLLFTSGAHVQIPALYPNIRYDAVRDFAPVGRIGASGFIFVVHPSVNATNMREFIAQAKANDRKWSLGTYAAGSTGAVFGTYLTKAEGLDMPVAVFNGEGPALTALVGGTIQGGFFTAPGVKSFVQAGRLKALGTLAGGHMPSFPQLPTLVEQGMTRYDWPGSWIGLLAPARTPKAILERLELETKAVTQDAEFRKTYTDTDVLIAWRGSTDFAADIQRETTVWRQLVEQLGIKVE